MTAKRRTTRSKTVRQFIRVCRMEKFPGEGDAILHTADQASKAGIVVVGDPVVRKVTTALSKAEAWEVVFEVSGTTAKPKAKAQPKPKTHRTREQFIEAEKKVRAKKAGGLTVEKIATGRYRWLVKKGAETVSKHRTKTEAEEAAR